MWKRQELKSTAKGNLKNNYWPSVVASFIFSMLTYVSAGSAKSEVDSLKEEGFSLSNFTPEQAAVLVSILAGAFAFCLVGSLLIKILIRNPIKVGYAHFLLNCEGEKTAKVGDMFSALKGNYVSSGIKMFTTGLITDLWYIVFFVPGVIKTYQYRMVSFVLAENPSLSGKEARALSKEMMKGHKWKAFVLDLSFIGWYILSGLTAGMLGVFYVDPYNNLTDCELYKTVRK